VRLSILQRSETRASASPGYFMLLEAVAATAASGIVPRDADASTRTELLFKDSPNGALELVKV
jgi:hypothetical protein